MDFTIAQSPDTPSTTASTSAQLPFNNLDVTSPASPEVKEGREDNTTLRRREANRLAAQRFRSRKKGYQDSLEDRIRILEEEKESLMRRFGDIPEDEVPSRSPETPQPRDTIDVDVRVASLESANRRLRDELRSVVQENERLKDEIESWKRWQSDRPRALPSIDFIPAPPRSTLPPPLERTRSYPNPAHHDVVLPPLRLPPISPSLSEARSLFPNPPTLPSLANNSPRPFTSPYPLELDREDDWKKTSFPHR